MVAATVGPLAELRRAINMRANIHMDENHIIIDSNTRLDKAAPTEFHSMRGRGTPYALATLYLQYTHHDKPYTDYYNACDKANTGHVLPVDKRDVVAYLRGEIDTSPNIEIPKSEASKSRSVTATFGQLSNSAAEPSATEAPKAVHISKQHSSLPAALSEKGKFSFAQHRAKVRDQRSLDSIMIVKDLDFSSLREKLSQHVTDSKNGRIAPTDAAQKSDSQPAYDPRGDRYTSNEERFWRENMGSDFQNLGIDMSGSFKDKPSSAPGPATQNANKRKHERADTKSRPQSPPKRPKRVPTSAVPIVIVPVGFNNLVCHGNALELFQNGHYVSAEELVKRNVPPIGKVTREELIRVPGGNCSRAKYHIVSNPSRLTSEEWDNVVSIVCSGQEWQFKNWPIYGGGVKELFRKVHAVHFHFDDRPPAGKSDSWPIKKIPISRSRRHTDHQVNAQFWSSLDEFLRRGKGKYLRY
ncbi:Cell division cycle protein 73 [Gracilariopsis chorda]|uniref:Cell division cycle protein 73 n=1 Tax=Gracilariopsis chorda TaxID=448386 RepID=A0A2V3J001_9FLOR|nr:Cell division cycle protein 73 [Gracilariopsis chorda]|eukprot:PXF47724.1 Cell division cycle protein 73 [Gracilariopsis chorda]